METGDVQKIEQHRIISNGVLIYQSDNSRDNNNIFYDHRSDNNCRDTWGTWEELLLASAVKRHGLSSWDAVAAEVQARTTALLPSSSTPDACRLKYSDLHLRFTDAETGAVEHEAARVPWLEELRKLRVAELKREVQRFDVSILSLQLKVKRLEEEREKSLVSRNDVTEEDEDESNFNKVNNRNVQSSDLEGSGNGKPGEARPAKTEESEEERSVNESNSTGSVGKKQTSKVGGSTEISVIRPGSRDPDPDSSGYGVKEEGETGDDRKLRGDESVSEFSGEAESSASLGKGKMRLGMGRRDANEIETARARGGDEVGPGVRKTEPLIAGLLELVRTHKHGPIFHSRLQSQETDSYTKLVRHHLDLEVIEARLERGSYPSHLAFYRDLLLMFNNAIVFFSKTSTEFATASELRSLVSNEMKSEPQKSDSALAPSNVSVEVKTEFPKPELFFNRHKVPTLIACRRRSSMAGKPSSSLNHKSDSPVEQMHSSSKSATELKSPVVELMLKSEDKPVTGARSTRRTKKSSGRGGQGSLMKKNPPAAPKTVSVDKLDCPKSDSKKMDPLMIDKKRSAADFLKRIKTSSPIDPVKNMTSKKDGDSAEESREKDKKMRKSAEQRTAKGEHSPSRGTNGRPPKKAAETSSSSVSGKRGRSKESSKRAKKRSRK